MAGRGLLHAGRDQVRRPRRAGAADRRAGPLGVPDAGYRRTVPPADAVLACPLTFNSVNKFAHGHADNFAVGLLCEMVGYGVPVVVVPHCKPQLASHPAFAASLETLRGMGVRVLFDPDAPYERRLPPWREVIDALPVRAGAG